MARINFEVDQSQVKYIESLVAKTGLKTKVGLFNTALTLFEWAVRERLAGRSICSQDLATGAIKEIEMPGFPPLDRSANPWSVPAQDASGQIMRSQLSQPNAPSVKNLPQFRQAYLAQVIELLPTLAETPQQAKEVQDVINAFGVEIEPATQKKLRSIMAHK